MVCSRTAPHPDGIDNGCSVTFIKRTHNNLYCCAECTRIQTNANIMGKYYEKQKRLRGEIRICSSCHETVLSRYNDGNICNLCTKQADKERTMQALKMFEELTDGTD